MQKMCACILKLQVQGALNQMWWISRNCGWYQFADPTRLGWCTLLAWCHAHLHSTLANV